MNFALLVSLRSKHLDNKVKPICIATATLQIEHLKSASHGFSTFGISRYVISYYVLIGISLISFF